ncbi:MAG TPA: NAD-dependent epimerase/dehydratase family protein [Syntrophorhabdaceae bacterium]|jgi:nucleoside-diphosphate-sugar epimerase
MDKLQDLIMEDGERICSRADLGKLDGSRILITGASGLVGVHLLASLAYLASSGKGRYELTAAMQSRPPAYLAEIIERAGGRIFRGDLTDAGVPEGLPKADYIIHSAGYAQPGRFLDNPVKTIQINTSALFALFQKLAPRGKLLFVSTSEVYSGSPNIPYREPDIGTTTPTHPRACYIESKRCGEAICGAYRQSGVDAASARLSLAYGPGTGKGDGRVLNAFIEKALKGTITLLDHGEAGRTYCYVSDAVELMWNILLKGREPVYNVGGISRTTVRELAVRIGEYLRVPVVFPDETRQLAGTPEDVRLDMAKAREEFGKEEYLSLDEGLARTIEWQKILYAQ